MGDRSSPGRIRRAYRWLVPQPSRDRVARWRWHAREGVQILGARNDPIVRNLRRRLADLEGQYAGQRCFIMGNGPSLNRMELDRFEGETIWGLNRCYLLFDRIPWRPQFYVAVDERVVPDTAGEIAELQVALPETTFFFPVHYRLRGVLPSTANTYWYRQLVPHLADLPWSMFSGVATRGLYGVYTVTIAAMQLAVHLGFNPIYLIGCDTSYSVPLSVLRDESNPDALVSTSDDDMNHFDARYFGAGRKWHEPHVDRMVLHYEHARAACDALGVEVYNATLGGELEVFPRINYRDLV